MCNLHKKFIAILLEGNHPLTFTADTFSTGIQKFPLAYYPGGKELLELAVFKEFQWVAAFSVKKLHMILHDPHEFGCSVLPPSVTHVKLDFLGTLIKI